MMKLIVWIGVQMVTKQMEIMVTIRVTRFRLFSNASRPLNCFIPAVKRFNDHNKAYETLLYVLKRFRTKIVQVLFSSACKMQVLNTLIMVINECGECGINAVWLIFGECGEKIISIHCKYYIISSISLSDADVFLQIKNACSDWCEGFGFGTLYSLMAWFFPQCLNLSPPHLTHPPPPTSLYHTPPLPVT